MKNDSDEDSFSSLISTANGEVKTDTKTEKDISNMHEISEDSKTELEDVHECSEACSVVLDISLISAAFQYYKYIKEKNLPWDAFKSSCDPLDSSISSSNPLDSSIFSSNQLDSSISSNPLDPSISSNPLDPTISSNPLDPTISSSNPLDPSISSSNIWDNSDTLIKETDCSRPLDSTTDLEKTLSDLQMDSDLMSEWPKFNTDFLNLCNFFDEQLESNESLSNQFTIHENKVSDQTIATIETGHPDSKSLCNDSSDSIQPETDYESLETRSAASKSSLSWSQQSENTGDGGSVLKHFHVGGYFPEELDYEPSEAGETEAKESDNEFCNDDHLKEEEGKSFPHYCSHPGNSALQERIEETGVPEEHAEAKQDFISFYESHFESGTDRSSLENNYNGYFEYVDEEDDSESDSEHSFKRNSSRNRQVNDLESLQPPSVNSDVSMISQLNTINEVMLYIGEQCKCGNVNEAIAAANRYMSISVEAVQLEIFKELFINVIDLIKSPVFSVGDVRISKSLGDVMDLFQQSKLLDSDLCSLVVSECFGCDHAIETGKEFISVIQKIKVPVNSSAISSYVDIVIPSEVPSLDLISFLEYVKYVCNLSCPKTLLCEALERFSKQEEGSLPFGFFRLCKFLCSISSKEVELNHLQNFIKFCIKNGSWTQISSFFRAWCSTDGHLVGCLQGSLLFRPEDAGLFYEKLADEIYENGDVSLYLVGILGQLGVCLMLEVFSQKLYDSAFDVLFTLHQRNINYLELQAGLLKPPSYLKSLPNFSDMFVFPFTVAFAALDICLHLERFRDAYSVFKSFSLQLPSDMDIKLKLKVRSRRFRYLLRLVQELFRIDPLKLGLQAFHDILSVAEDFSSEELEDFAEEIQVIYNKYLTYAVNGCQLHTVLELFKCSEGARKELFIVHPQVLRGLLVTCAQNNRLDEAWKFFSLGYVRKVYNTEQIETEEFVWRLTVISSWTVFEVEFAIKNFIKNICLTWHGKFKNEINMQPSVKIVFKESEEECSEIECLKKPRSIDLSRDAVCSVLKSLNSNIKWIENQNPVSFELVFKTVYNYWMNWRKNSRKFLLEDVSPNAEFKIQFAEEDFGFKYSTESNSVKTLEKVLDPLTPESSVADSSYQLISDKISHHSLTLLENCLPATPETTFLENSDQKFSDLTIPTSTEQEQIISGPFVSRNIEQGQTISDLSVSRSIEKEQIVSDLNVSENIEQEQIISSSNLLSPNAHSDKTTCLTPDEKLSETDAPENILTDFCSESPAQVISEKKVRKVCNKKKVFKSLGQIRSKKITSKIVKLKKKFNRVYLKKKPISKKKTTMPAGTETKNVHPGSSKKTCSSKPCMIKNFQVTLRNSAQTGMSRVVSLGSQMKLAESKNTASVLNIPETVFQKIVLFLRSKVLLKCRDLQPEQQQEKANHLASLFIQSNVVGALDKKTMKLLNEFADGCI